MKIVLWVSRHQPLPAQLAALREKLGEVEIVKIEHAPNAEFVIERAKQLGAKVIVPVLPLSFIARLVEEARREGFTVLYARMEPIALVKTMEEAAKLVAAKPGWRSITTYADGTVRVFEFKAFEKIVEVKLVTEPW